MNPGAGTLDQTRGPDPSRAAATDPAQPAPHDGWSCTRAELLSGAVGEIAGVNPALVIERAVCYTSIVLESTSGTQSIDVWRDAEWLVAHQTTVDQPGQGVIAGIAQLDAFVAQLVVGWVGSLAAPDRTGPAEQHPAANVLWIASAVDTEHRGRRVALMWTADDVLGGSTTGNGEEIELVAVTPTGAWALVDDALHGVERTAL